MLFSKKIILKLLIELFSIAYCVDDLQCCSVHIAGHKINHITITILWMAKIFNYTRRTLDNGGKFSERTSQMEKYDHKSLRKNHR